MGIDMTESRLAELEAKKTFKGNHVLEEQCDI